MQESLLISLRQATSESHCAIEEMIGPEHFTTREGYQQLLGAFYSFYAPLESELRKHQGKWPGGYKYVDFSRTRWLEQDFAALRISPEQFRLTENIPVIPSLAEAFGVAYVVEGSALGGRHICKLLSASIPANARNFFGGFGEKTRDYWKSLCDSLEMFAQTGDRTATITAAAGVFDELRHHFEEQHIDAWKSLKSTTKC